MARPLHLAHELQVRTGKRALLLATLAGCSRPATATAPPPAPGPEWTVQVTAPAELAYTFLSTTEAIATRAERPIIFLDGGVHFATSDERVTLTRGPLPADGQVVRVVEEADRTAVETIRGTQIVVPYTLVPRGAYWFDVAGLVAVWTAGEQLAFAQISADGSSLAWSASAEATPGQVELLGWWGPRPLFATRSATGGRLYALDLAARAVRALVKLPPGPIALAPARGQIAVVYRAASGSHRAAIYRLDEARRIREFDLRPVTERATIGERATLGFDGTVLWTYLYQPAGRDDGHAHRESCGYEVYDVATGQRLRTLETAAGSWAGLVGDCRVRALLPRPDGGVIAVHASDHTTAIVVKFAHPP